MVQATTISHTSYYSQLLHGHVLLLVLSTVHFHIAASTILLKLSLKPPMASYCIRIKSKSLLWHDFTIATSLTSCSATPLTPLLLCFSPGSLPFGQTNQTLSYHKVPSVWIFFPHRPLLNVTFSDRPSRTIKFETTSIHYPRSLISLFFALFFDTAFTIIYTSPFRLPLKKTKTKSNNKQKPT